MGSGSSGVRRPTGVRHGSSPTSILPCEGRTLTGLGANGLCTRGELTQQRLALASLRYRRAYRVRVDLRPRRQDR
jgi:hypothetical protein